jgi:uncharacterized protein
MLTTNRTIYVENNLKMTSRFSWIESWSWESHGRLFRIFLALLLSYLALAASDTIKPVLERSDAVRPVLERAALNQVQMQGHLRQYLNVITEQWLLPVPLRNPGMLSMFANRDRAPLSDLLPWSGEFAGKYLTSAVQVLRLTHDPRLKNRLKSIVSTLIEMQDADGYLGPFPRGSRLTGMAPNCSGGTWDCWGHYHIMLGLLLWHEETGDQAALACAVNIGDLVYNTFLKSGKMIVQTGNAEMNHAIVHGLSLLYRWTNEQKYLDQANQIIAEFQEEGAGNYLRSALAGKEFFQCPKPRWESLHSIMALAELYWLTGNADYRKAFEQFWWSIVKLDRHNNGGFSSGEQAQGNPYNQGAIETCCTIAWMAMSVEMLRLTGDPIVADELELSMLNSVYGYQERGGKWVTYNTPMNGTRIPSAKDFRPGTEDLNCCSAHGPRGFGLLSDWGLMRKGDDLVLNWYGPCELSTRIGDSTILLKQNTDYPRNGRVVIDVNPSQKTSFNLLLRIPNWSANTQATVNGVPIDRVSAGKYLSINRPWQTGDRIVLTFDMSVHYWIGERECSGKAAFYRGPLLLALNEAPPGNPIFSQHWKKYDALNVTNGAGGTVDYEFEGTSIIWHGYKFDDAGMTRVDIDGKTIAIVDQYGSVRGEPFIWQHTNLKSGKHSIRLVAMGKKSENSKDTYVNVLSFSQPSLRDNTPQLDTKMLKIDLLDQVPGGPLVSVKMKDAAGHEAVLRDFASCGMDKAQYWSWLNINDAPSAPFTRDNPLRLNR